DQLFDGLPGNVLRNTQAERDGGDARQRSAGAGGVRQQEQVDPDLEQLGAQALDFRVVQRLRIEAEPAGGARHQGSLLPSKTTRTSPSAPRLTLRLRSSAQALSSAMSPASTQPSRPALNEAKRLSGSRRCRVGRKNVRTARTGGVRGKTM